jgi:acetyl-CoA acetyltransferase
MNSNVAIVHAETMKFSENFDDDPFDYAWTVGKSVLEKTGYHRPNVGLFSFGCDLTEYEEAKLRQMLGVPEKEKQFFRGRESGVQALNYALRSIQSGYYDIAFVGAAEKSLNTGNNNNYNLLRKGDEYFIEVGKAKMQMMHELGVTEESLAGIPVKAHFHGSNNSQAQFRNLIRRANVLNSDFVEGAKPLRTYEIAFENSCGAVGMLLCSESEARKHHNPVFIEGFGTSQGVNEEHMYIVPSIEMTIEKACKNVINPKELSLIQVPDNATPLEAIALANSRISPNEIEEILKRTFVNADDTTKQSSPWPYELDKPLFVNTDGGDKAAGHPGYPTAYMRRIAETYLQLRGDAGKRQVQNITHGLVLSIDDYRQMATSAHLLGVR